MFKDDVEVRYREDEEFLLSTSRALQLDLVLQNGKASKKFQIHF